MPYSSEVTCSTMLMCDLQVCCWLAAEASPFPPIRSVCSPHTLAEGIFFAGPLCAVGWKVNIIFYCFIVQSFT